MTDLTQQEQDDLAYVLSLTQADNEPLRLDLSDERQYRCAVALQTLGGHTPETRPGMHHALAETRARHLAEGPGERAPSDDQGFESGGQVTDISLVEGTDTAAATGFVALVGGALQLNAVIIVTPTANNTIVAYGSASHYNEGDYMPLYAAPIPGQLTPMAMTSLVAYNYQLTQGGPWHSEVVTRETQLVPQADPKVVHPNKHEKVSGKTAIRIALGRGQNTQTDVDYWYWYGTGTTTYALPFVGSVELSSPPITPLNENTLQIYARLARKGNGGSAPLPPAQMKQLFNSLQVSGRLLTWVMAPPDTAPPWNPGQPLVWGDLHWSTGELDYLTIQFTVPLATTPISVATVTVQSADVPDNKPLDGTTDIPPLEFLYSCLANGTPIRLADGSSIPIEQVVRGTRVACGDGADREVTSTTIAHHRGKALRLLTESDHELVLSHNHVVMTPAGALLAMELEPGAEVNVEGGTAIVARVQEENFDGQLCNLSLSESGDTLNPATSTVYAAGVEVCDYEIQVRHDRARRRDPERIRAKLEPRYQADYQHYLDELAAKS